MRDDREREVERLSKAARKMEYTGRMRAIKAASGCADCGFKNPLALDFHHIDARNKRFSLGCTREWVGYGWLTILDEIAKCIVLCANCHRIRHREAA